MKHRTVMLVLKSLIALVSALHAAGAQMAPTRVPYRLLNGQVVIDAAVGEGEPQAAILDIGLSRCAMTPEAASRLFLPGEAPTELPTIYGAARVPTLKAQTVRVGGLPIGGAAFVACDLWRQLSSAPPKDAPALWIGTSALASLCVTIDPSTQTITLSDPRTPLPRKATVVPFDTRDARVWVDARADGLRKYRTLLTTGAAGTLLPASVVRGLKLKTLSTIATKHPGGKAGSVAVVQLDRLMIGALEVPQVPALAMLDGNAGGIDPELGVVGTDILLDYRVTISFPQRRIAFEKLVSEADTPASKGATPAKPSTRPSPRSPGGVTAPGGTPLPPSPAPSRY